jgi:hypothetical protein
MQQCLVDVAGLKFSSPFVGQDMQETSFPFFIKSLMLHVPTRKMSYLLDTYNIYIKKASFCGLTMQISILERYQTR